MLVMAIGGDPKLEVFAASLRAQTERDLRSRENEAGGRDFQELLRAGTSLESVHDAEPVLQLRVGQQFDAPSLQHADPVLAQFCSDLRASTERALQTSFSSEIMPELPRSRRSRWAPLAGIAAAAAMVMLMVDLPGVVAFGQKVQNEVASMAPWNKEESVGQNGVATKPLRTRAIANQGGAQGTADKGKATEVEPSLNLDEDVDVTIEDLSPGATAKNLAPKKLSDAALMRQAHRLWKQGKIKRAQRMFRRVAYGSSNRDAAQAAFADLFSIGRQLGGRSILVKEWNRYLKKFPKGRYAQDALAGRCAAFEDPGSEKTCWKAYLKRFPRGLYARRGKKSLGE